VECHELGNGCPYGCYRVWHFEGRFDMGRKKDRELRAMLNWSLIRAPVNWITITLMLLFAIVAADMFSNLIQSSGNGQS
jgi:hypothetical protein